MTKEMDFLSLTKTTQSVSSVKNTNSSPKKEGLSLFDSLLENDFKETKTTNENNSQKDNGPVQTKSSKETIENPITKDVSTNINKNQVNPEQIDNTKELKNSSEIENKNIEKNVNTNTKDNLTQDNSEIKKEVTKESKPVSTTSLLDRMIIEAKKNIKTTTNVVLKEKGTSNIEVVKQEPTLVTKENTSTSKEVSKESMINVVVKNVEKETIENPITKDVSTNINKNQVNPEQIDNTKELKNSSEIENKNIEKNVNTNTKDTLTQDNSEIKKEVTKESKPVSTTSLLDRMIIEAKKNIKTTPNVVLEEKAASNIEIVKQEPTLVTKENTSTSKEVSKESMTNVVVKNVEKEIIENPITKELKNSSEIENKIENKNIEKNVNTNTKDNLTQDNSEIETVKTQNPKIELTVDTKNSELKNEGQSIPKIQVEELKDKNIQTVNVKQINEEIKTNIIKEAIQSTINFDDISDESKNIVKSVDNIKKIVPEEAEKNSEKNLEPNEKTKNETKIDNKVGKTLTEKINVTTEKENLSTATTNTSVGTDNKTVSKEFAKLDPSAIVKDEQRVNINKGDLLKDNSEDLKTPSESKNTRSLMDRLLENAKNSTPSVNNKSLEEQNTVSKSNDVVTNIFLSSQKNSIYNQMAANKSEGIQVVKDAKNVGDIKKGAQILDLGLDENSIEIDALKNNSKNNSYNDKIENKDSLLNKLAFNRYVKNNEVLEKVVNPSPSTISTTGTINTSTAITGEEAISLNVNPSLALTIQNRIIGAQQHMSSMMSDVARKMYENYKPPVTAFRINLFPAQLGHIAILMKNDKENSITISLNMSNSNTHDSFVENQGVLRDALNRNFNNNQTTFNLDFNMQNENSNNQSFSEDNQHNKQDHENVSSNEILEAINQNQDVGEDLNYL